MTAAHADRPIAADRIVLVSTAINPSIARAVWGFVRLRCQSALARGRRENDELKSNSRVAIRPADRRTAPRMIEEPLIVRIPYNEIVIEEIDNHYRYLLE